MQIQVDGASLRKAIIALEVHLVFGPPSQVQPGRLILGVEVGITELERQVIEGIHAGSDLDALRLGLDHVPEPTCSAVKLDQVFKIVVEESDSNGQLVPKLLVDTDVPPQAFFRP